MLTSTVSYADTSIPDTYVVYDDLGNEYVLNEGEVLGVLYDKYGNVKEENIITPRQIFVLGSKTTLEPGDYFVTYQYVVQSSFFAGFYYYFKNETSPSTTPGGKLKITLQDAADIGGSRNNIISRTFNTTYYEGAEDEDCEFGLSKTIDTNRVSSDRPYYNARFENVGSKTITVCWSVGRD